jgi:imidazolonepropionase-like amidohydrolase
VPETPSNRLPAEFANLLGAASRGRLQARSISRRSLLVGAAVAAATAPLLARPALARIPDAPTVPTAFTNIRLFDGKSGVVRSGLTVIVEGRTIAAVQPAGEAVPGNALMVDGGGRTLMPGLIDAHWHTMLVAIPLASLLMAEIGDINLIAAAEAERTLMRGFTSVRDLSGPSFALKRAIDGGLMPGPRIWPSGAMISQTSGHGDFRMPYEIPAQMGAPLSRGEAINGGVIADGPPEVTKRAREQLMLGASQLKLAAGGGVSSNYDPLDVAQYTEAEFRAAVDAAENWGTYVTVHAYTPRAIQTAIRGGVRCIDHGHLMDEETARIMAGSGTWLSMQPFDDEFATPFPEGSANRTKQLQMFSGTDNAYALAKTHNLKTAWGTDILFDPALAFTQGAQLAKMVKWYPPDEVLRTATGINAALLEMSGPRNPYPGRVGVIEPGAWADILLVDGDPIANIDLLADAEANLLVIMKDGRIYKNRG